MDWMTQKREKTQLGQILIDKKLISQAQLEEAIRQQGQNGRRLGEILADMKLITQAQVRGAIRRQRNLRMAAAFAASLLGPLQAYAAVTAAPVAAVATRAVGERSLREMSDEELGQVSGQGRDDDALRDQARQAELRLQALLTQSGQAGQGSTVQVAQHLLQDSGMKVLGQLAEAFNPLAMLLTADTLVSGVTYDPANSQATIGKDGAVTLRLPSTIGQVAFKNIRVGSEPGPSFGSITINDIDLRGTTVSVTPHH